MSHFHFPRLHFSGKAFIDPATGNNNYHYPLVNFEPISGDVVLPPRIYLDTVKDIATTKVQLADYAQYFKKDENQNSYIELSPIAEAKTFKKWMSSPLGSLKIDEAFHKLYKHILTTKDSIALEGLCPAYWNYYGTMNFSLKDVRIHNIQLFKNGSIQNVYHKTSSDSVSNLLGSELSFDFRNGRNSAVMIDLSPTLSLFSQVFCSRISLSKEGHTKMEGKPLKASLRQMNVNRVENDSSITGSSGTFYQTIPINKLNKESSTEILEFFTQNIPSSEKLDGISIRYDLSEVQEDTNPDYEKLDKQPNPAELFINGTISAHFEGELLSHPPGRRLDYLSPYKNKFYLGSSFAHYQKDINLLSIDLIGSLPQIKNESQYQLIELGQLSVNLILENQTILIGELCIIKDKINLNQLKSNAGIFDYKIKNPEISSLLAEGKGRLEICKSDKVLLKEKELRIISDQTGIYADQDDPKELGFFSNSSNREHCQIKILQRGQPFLKALKVMIVEVSVLPYGRGERTKVLDTIQSIQHDQFIEWPTNNAGQFFYHFVPIEYAMMPLDIKSHMIKSGEFINLRVLPSFEYDEFEGTQINFEDIYKNILENFDLLYPSSSIITPFKEEHLSKQGNFLSKIMGEDYWADYLFMPSSRDLPKGKRKLMFDWIAQQNKVK